MIIRKLPSRLRTEGGFALTAVIFVMALLTVLAITGLGMTADDRWASNGIRESTRAFYTAEAGQNVVIASWDSLQYDTLIAGPGDSLDLGWQTLPENGNSYRAVIQRVDNGGTKFFELTVEGRVRGGLGALRVLSVSFINAAPPASSIITSAVRGGPPGELMRLRENEFLSGRDTIPPGWAGECNSPLADMPGVTWSDTMPTGVRIDPPAGLDGVPLLVEDPTITAANLLEFDGFNYADLVAQADKVYPAGPNTLDGSDIFPVESPPGTCDTSVLNNWGIPDNPAHPCFKYFPIIYTPGKFTLDSVQGQGILLADDEVIFEGNTKFYGIVITDRIRFRDEATVLGGMITTGPWDSRHFTTIRYSQCAVQRALEATTFGSTIELLPGSWTEILR